ncbi:MAG: hypothetical protein AB7E79_16575 [Rhodospirillaceae bacterium]
MFMIVDSNTQEQVARFSTLEYARAGAAAHSRDYHRAVTIVFEATRQSVAQYKRGREIEITATILAFPAMAARAGEREIS